jgi:hypothetical protein
LPKFAHPGNGAGPCLRHHHDGALQGSGSGAIADPTQQATCHAAGTILGQTAATAPFHQANICSTLDYVEGWRAEQQRQQTKAWSPGQRILNDTGARVPEHTFHQPVPIIARIVWEQDGEEHIDTEAAGWSGQNVYVRLPDPRYRLTSVWLDAADVKRR